MKKLMLVSVVLVATLSACGESSSPRPLPTAEQKAEFKAIQDSMKNAEYAVPSRSSLDKSDVALGGEEARVQMQSQLNDAVDAGDCKVTKTSSETKGGEHRSPRTSTLKVAGASCPISYDVASEGEDDGVNRGSQHSSVNYEVTKTAAGEKYRALNDVDSVVFTAELNASTSNDRKSFNLSGNVRGKVRSQKYGTMIINATVSASLNPDGTGNVLSNDRYELPGFTIEREITATVKGKKTETSYTINGNAVTAKDYREYGESLLPVGDFGSVSKNAVSHQK